MSWRADYNQEAIPATEPTMVTTGEKLAREFILLFQYFLISLIAAAAAHFASETTRHGLGGTGVATDPAVAVNFRGLITSLWDEYYRWWFLTFFSLSAARLIFVFVLSRRKGINTLE